jgi:hypothetical protein
MNLTAHFTLEELTRSDYATRHGIDNSPTADVLANLYVLADGLERVRSVLDHPVWVSSGYRCPKVNAGLGGARYSQHMQGLAADIHSTYGAPREVCEAILDAEDFIEFDQLIFEGDWTHISFAPGKPRGQVLTAHFGGGGVSYSAGIV